VKAAHLPASWRWRNLRGASCGHSTPADSWTSCDRWCTLRAAFPHCQYNTTLELGRELWDSAENSGTCRELWDSAENSGTAVDVGVTTHLNMKGWPPSEDGWPESNLKNCCPGMLG